MQVLPEVESEELRAQSEAGGVQGWEGGQLPWAAGSLGSPAWGSVPATLSFHVGVLLSQAAPRQVVLIALTHLH